MGLTNWGCRICPNKQDHTILELGPKKHDHEKDPESFVRGGPTLTTFVFLKFVFS